MPQVGAHQQQRGNGGHRQTSDRVAAHRGQLFDAAPVPPGAGDHGAQLGQHRTATVRSDQGEQQLVGAHSGAPVRAGRRARGTGDLQVCADQVEPAAMAFPGSTSRGLTSMTTGPLAGLSVGSDQLDADLDWFGEQLLGAVGGGTEGP
ncbi:hypothetical protein ACTXG6_29380 [Pseudonocardia sp. Cha107L01]|uniref:hypothetical protein n=1 Tax=Pseudonocardia sp. Cha107L01 TaxID=3457576 RepID=UPI00403EA17F